MIAGIAFVVVFCALAGCTGFAGSKSAGSDGLQNSGVGSGGGSGGTGSPGSYPQNSYFTFDCRGDWKDTSIHGEAPWNHHGTFTVSGDVSFPITYDYHETGFALYTATDARGSDMSSPLRINGESWECVGAASDCKPCHYVFEGEIYAGGLMVYNKSADSSRRWTVFFSRMPGGEGIWHTNSIRQTEGSCPVTDIEQVGPVEITLPAVACFTRDERTGSGTPFSFSDGSGFTVSPHIEPGDYLFTSLNPRVVFHLGKAPS